MHILLLALVAGGLIGYVGRVRGKLAVFVDRTTMVVLFVILAVMGAKLAGPKVVGTLGSIGLGAITFAGFTVLGSLVAVRIAMGALGWARAVSFRRATRREASRP